MAKVDKALLRGIDALPWGPAMQAEAERVVALAQESGNEDLEFAARMRLTATGTMSSVTDVALTNFAWCLAKHKEDPARFVGGPDESDTIFWHFKWMHGHLLGSPVFDLEQVAETLADFETTYKAAGLQMSAVVTAKMEIAVRTRDLEGALKWRAKLEKMPRDAYSSCNACVPSDYVDVDLLAGDDEAAAQRAMDMWNDGESCGSEPETALATVLLSLAKLGRDEEAIEAFEEVYEECKNDRDDLGNIARCVQFLAASGNEDRAFTLVERHLPWLSHDALSESEHFDAAKAFALALTRFAAQGHGDVLVRGSNDAKLAFLIPAADAARTVSELADALWAAATDLAARFDARNGNDGYARELAATRALVDTTYPVELDGDEEGSFKPLLVRAATPASPQEWLAKAADYRWVQDNVRVLEALEHAIPGLEGIDLVRAYALQVAAAGTLGDVGLHDRANAAWIDAVRAAYGEASAAFAAAIPEAPTPSEIAALVASAAGVDPQFVARAHSKAAEALVSTGDVGLEQVEQALAEADKTVALLTGNPLPPDVAAQAIPSALSFKAQLLGFLGRLDDAVAALDEALALAPTRAVKGALTHLKGNIVGRAGDAGAAVAAFDEAITLLAAAGYSEYAQRVAAQAGTLWQDQDVPGEAVARFAYALSIARPGEPADDELAWRYGLALIDSDSASEAVPVLEGVLESAAQAGAPAEILADMHFHLGRAYDGAYDARAGDEYVKAAELFSSVDQHGAAAIAGLRAGRELSYQNRREEAVVAYRNALGAVAVDANPPLEADLHLGLAAALSALKDAGWKDAIASAIEIASGLENTEYLFRAIVGRASMHDDHAEAAEVVAHGPAAIEISLAQGENEQAATVIQWVAGALAALGRVPEAVSLLETAINEDDTYEISPRLAMIESLRGILKAAGLKDQERRWKAEEKRLIAFYDDED